MVDRAGLPALSMRRLGSALGVEAMALYHHFPNKAALLDGVIERVLTRVRIPAGTETDWRDGMRRYARSALDNLAEHPNVVPLLLSRPGATTANHRVMESLLGTLTGAGFTPCRALDLLYGLNSLIVLHGAVRAGGADGAGGAGDAGDAGAEPAGERGQTEHLAALSPDEFPLLAAAASASAERGPNARFDAAVDALLAGFAAQLD